MDDTITYKVRALKRCDDGEKTILENQIVEVTDDGEYWHPVGTSSMCGFVKECFEIIEDSTGGTAWTTP